MPDPIDHGRRRFLAAAAAPSAGHRSLFQFHESFVRQASLFLDSDVL